MFTRFLNRSPCASIGHQGLEFLCLLNHLHQFLDGGNAANKMLGVVGFLHLLCEVLGYAMTELLDGIDAGCLEQFGKLRTYALDSEQVGMVGPLQDELLADACLFCQGSTAFRSGTLCQQVLYLNDACLLELRSISLAYALDVDNLVSHSF